MRRRNIQALQRIGILLGGLCLTVLLLTGCGRDNDASIANQNTYDPSMTGAKVAPGRTPQPQSTAGPYNQPGNNAATDAHGK